MTLKHNLRYVTDCDPGYKRKRVGRGFIYVDDEGQQVNDKNLLKRIEALVIPPNWQDVWICGSSNGHIQATGRDDRNRKQYIYHPRFIAYRQQNKYDRLAEFARLLPAIRETTDAHLRKHTWTREKALALAVTLMDEAFLRIGNEYYKDQNNTYGLTTLRRKHLHDTQGALVLEYKAKSNKYRKVKIKNKRLRRLLKESASLPGYEIFRYKNGDGSWHSLQSQEVNDFLREITDQELSSKNFRTWGGGVMAIKYYQQALEEIEKHPKRSFKRAIVKRVARLLGNTVSVCEKYYIHPKILEVLTNRQLGEFRKGVGTKYRSLKDHL